MGTLNPSGMATSIGSAGVLLINFGEPETTSLDEVVPFLERIFAANSRLEPGSSPESERSRSHMLAQQRAPDLARSYARIGGSPLNEQALEQARMLSAELTSRGVEIPVEVGMQFTEPTIEDAITRLRRHNPNKLAVLPVYPLCGPSTTVAALISVTTITESLGWEPEILEITGWHRHPGYHSLRSRTIRHAAQAANLDLNAESNRLVFSAHGTPMRYIREGSRYVEYVEEWCAAQGQSLGVHNWNLGYQNHSSRRVRWTQPSIEEALQSLDGVKNVLIDPVSFMHEQSETLMELDIDLRDEAAALGIRLHRVPVPHDDGAFSSILADLVLMALGQDVRGVHTLTRCECRPGAAVCFNGA
jgi:ferrochelatase